VQSKSELTGPRSDFWELVKSIFYHSPAVATFARTKRLEQLWRSRMLSGTPQGQLMNL